MSSSSAFISSFTFSPSSSKFFSKSTTITKRPNLTSSYSIIKCTQQSSQNVHTLPTSSIQLSTSHNNSNSPTKSSIPYSTLRRIFLSLLLFSVFRVTPTHAIPAVEQTAFASGLTASFALVLASEIGDKTFFISALLSMKYSRILVLLGTMLALASMTIISVAIGQIFHALPTSLNSTIPFDDYAAVALLLWFGFQNIRDGLKMKQDEGDELEDAKGVVDKQTSFNGAGLKVIAQTSSLIFVAEWGDKSMLATVALAAAKSPLGVIVGGITGHLVASIIAVVGGSFLGRFVSEKNARLIGGVLFLVFAGLTIMGIY